MVQVRAVKEHIDHPHPIINDQAAVWRLHMVTVTDNAMTKLRELQSEHPDKTAFRVVFKGFG